MQHIIAHRKLSDIIASVVHQSNEAHVNPFTKFFAWCNAQEHNRLLWMAFTFCGFMLLALPCTALPYLLLNENNLNLWILTLVINVPLIALSLAAQPTKIILPALFISWMADAIIILTTIITFIVR